MRTSTAARATAPVAAAALPLWPSAASPAEPDQFVSQTHDVNVYGHACEVVVQVVRNDTFARASTEITGDSVCRTPELIIIELAYISTESGETESVSSWASGPTITIATLRAAHVRGTDHLVEWDPGRQGPSLFAQLRPK